MTRAPIAAPLLAAVAMFGAAVALLPADSTPSPDELRPALFGQEAVGADPATVSYQRIKAGDPLSAEYEFENFNRDKIKLGITAKKTAFDAYEAEWGYTNAALADLKSWLNKARNAALKDATDHDRSQAELDATLAALQTEYKQKQAAYLASRGFQLAKDGTVRVDMPALVKKNAPIVKSVAADLDAFARKKKYGPDDIIGAATAMTQTAMIYRVPPAVEGEKHTGGLLPPLSALLKGWGDCDTKSGVLASVLTNYPNLKMVGISAPEHYLLGVMRIPHKGELFVEYQGLQFVLIEPAGPAWLPPGTVADTTSALLGAADSYKIEPFF